MLGIFSYYKSIFILEKLKRKTKDYPGFIKYFTNTFWLLFEKVLRLLIGFTIGVWVARYLGPEKYGLLNYAQSFVALFSAISTLGLDRILVREIVKHPEKEENLLGTAFVLKIFGSILMLVVLAIAINFTSNDRYTNLLIFIIASATIFQAFNVIDFYFQAKVMSKYAVFANTFSLFMSSLVKILLIINNAPLIAFALVVVFDSITLAMGYLYFYIKKSSKFKLQSFLKFKKGIAISLLRDSCPLILSGIVVSIYMKIDQVMIKEMLDSEALGQYAAAVRLSEVWYFIPMVVSSSLFPAIINAKKVSEKLYYERLQKLYDLMVWMAIAIALPMTFLSDWVVRLLYGEEYNQAGSVLMIYIWAGVFVFLGTAQGNFWITNNLQKQLFLVTLSCAVVNVFLNLFLINFSGIKGAALATLISYGLGSLFFPLLFKDVRSMMSITYKTFCLWRYIK